MKKNEKRITLHTKEMALAGAAMELLIDYAAARADYWPLRCHSKGREAREKMEAIAKKIVDFAVDNALLESSGERHLAYGKIRGITEKHKKQQRDKLKVKRQALPEALPKALPKAPPDARPNIFRIW